ncbi:MAG TPA: hypothetical protein VJP79_07320 [Nitrososphaera sp.]|nr:hypothetical protein [Nitrososphaera sp.]
MSAEQIDRLRERNTYLEKENDALRQQVNYLRTLATKLFQGQGEEYLSRLEQITKQKQT